MCTMGSPNPPPSSFLLPSSSHSSATRTFKIKSLQQVGSKVLKVSVQAEPLQIITDLNRNCKQRVHTSETNNVKNVKKNGESRHTRRKTVIERLKDQDLAEKSGPPTTSTGEFESEEEAETTLETFGHLISSAEEDENTDAKTPHMLSVLFFGELTPLISDLFDNEEGVNAEDNISAKLLSNIDQKVEMNVGRENARRPRRKLAAQFTSALEKMALKRKRCSDYADYKRKKLKNPVHRLTSEDEEDAVELRQEESRREKLREFKRKREEEVRRRIERDKLAKGNGFLRAEFREDSNDSVRERARLLKDQKEMIRKEVQPSVDQEEKKVRCEAKLKFSNARNKNRDLLESLRQSSGDTKQSKDESLRKKHKICSGNANFTAYPTLPNYHCLAEPNSFLQLPNSTLKQTKSAELSGLICKESPKDIVSLKRKKEAESSKKIKHDGSLKTLRIENTTKVDASKKRKFDWDTSGTMPRKYEPASKKIFGGIRFKSSLPKKVVHWADEVSLVQIKFFNSECNERVNVYKEKFEEARRRQRDEDRKMLNEKQKASHQPAVDSEDADGESSTPWPGIEIWPFEVKAKFGKAQDLNGLKELEFETLGPVFENQILVPARIIPGRIL